MITTSYPHAPEHLSGPFVRLLVQGLAARGHEFDVVCPARAAATRIEAGGAVRVETVAAPRLGRGVRLGGEAGIPEVLRSAPIAAALVPVLVARLYAGARRALRARAVDRIWSHWLLPSGSVGADLGRRFRVPHLATAHGGDVHLIERLVRAPGVARGLRAQLAGTAFTAPAPRTARRVSRALEVPGVEVLPLGVEPPRAPERGHRSRRLRILFLGRFERVKGPDLLLDAAERLGADAGFEWVLAGAGRLDGALRERARSIPTPIRFAGVLVGSEKSAALRRADLVVFPSRPAPVAREDGLPHAALEALAHGVPVIAPRPGALAELVTSKGAGATYDAGRRDEDASLALADLLRHVGRRPDRLRAWERGAERAGAAFLVDRVVPLWERALAAAEGAGR